MQSKDRIKRKWKKVKRKKLWGGQFKEINKKEIIEVEKKERRK